MTTLPINNETMMYAILHHLPLNILWRVPGWNKKCERDIPLRHKRIDCFRLYYLTRSENCYGRLFSDCHTSWDYDIKSLYTVECIYNF